MANESQDVFTTEQAAQYLQVSRETIYRYIHEGKILASRVGRGYRIPRRSLDLLLWTTQSRQIVSLRNYAEHEIAEFLAVVKLDDDTNRVIQQFVSASSQR